MRIRLVIAVLMIVISGLACAQTEANDPPAQDLLDLSGTYNVTGTSLDGVRYAGDAIITRTTGNDYRIEWTFASQSQTGTGTFDGTTFNVKWQMGSEASGTATYTLQPDGSLVGTWTQDGVEGEGSESLTPQIE
ncbi:MAG: hypothetical protein L0332_16850 [Chloroflexi bacterium]|nr:hypothetical protein [Chloroflexota bacterium]MCI0575378.1 hypothetical protein [Chloroflexota bacterium]MCI0646374.1 hypothetical protein [Chloroflexota bacterium]MCI0728368.1 hypothetical protein [Chloroflexota bacterium]